MTAESCHCSVCGCELAFNEKTTCRACSIGASTIPPKSEPSDTNAQDATLAPKSPGYSFAFASESQASFSKYEIIEEIARGGMGVIYKARDQKLNRIVALKMILGGRFSSPDEMQRFQVESEAAAKLDHSGIVPVFEAGQHDGQAFLAMKYIGNGSLAERIDEFRDERKAAKLISSMADAVHHAHQRGILHRDLKPANVLIDENDQPLITDLGLAKSTAGDSNLTNTGAVLGTPSYMPPEQASGKSVTTSADIYSLGAMLYELLTGVPPHRGNSALETVLQVLNEPITAVREANAAVDRDLALICMHCLHPDPESRYSTAQALADDLDRWLVGEPVSVKPASFAKRAGQWVRHNQGIFYVGMLLMLGVIFSLPPIFSILGVADEVGGIYANTEEDPLPLIYSFTNIPLWVSIAGGIATLLLWPSLGMLVALVTRPKNWLSAALKGGIVAGLLAMLMTLLLGWVLFAIASQVSSIDTVRILASNVWPLDDGTSAEVGSESEMPDDNSAVENRLLEVYPGLSEVPYNNKANYVANRVVADGVAAGPQVGLGLFIGALSSMIPTIFGAVIAYVLLERRQRWWIFGPRYYLAWFSTFVAISMIIIIAMNGEMNGKPSSQYNFWFRFIWVSIPLVVCFLTLRRWRRKKARETSKPLSLSSDG